jgi:nicotinamide phosphoribosyltransferase
MFQNKENQKMVFFGLQAFIQEYLVEYFNKNFFNVPLDEVIETYKKYLNIQLGEGNYDIDNIVNLHKLGYLPLRISAIPEGTKVNMGVPCIEVTNTNEKFAWLVQWIECILQAELWKTCNHATIGNMYYKIAKNWYEKNVDSDIDPRMAFADFGMRGMSCMNEAVRCSAAWLLSANKTSSIPALPYIDKYYDADCSGNHIGIGAVSTEHSVMGANYALDGDERTFVKRLLTELYPNTSFSMVSDTYDYWNMVNNIIPSLKEEILAHNGKLFVRPDSGDQFETVVKTVMSLWENFGGTTNTKGYKVLNPHIGVILGDGCTQSVVNEIWKELDRLGFAANNVIFGIGAFCFSAIIENSKMIVNTRDTWGVAMKATYGVFGNKELMIYKDPKTDTDNLKKSHKGLIFVEKDGDDFKVTDGLLYDAYDEYSGFHNSALHTVFMNGEMYNRESFTTIRERLANEK